MPREDMGNDIWATRYIGHGDILDMERWSYIGHADGDTLVIEIYWTWKNIGHGDTLIILVMEIH